MGIYDNLIKNKSNYIETIATNIIAEFPFRIHEKIEYITNDSGIYHLLITFINSAGAEQQRRLQPDESISEITMNCIRIKIQAIDYDNVGGNPSLTTRISAY